MCDDDALHSTVPESGEGDQAEDQNVELLEVSPFLQHSISLFESYSFLIKNTKVRSVALHYLLSTSPSTWHDLRHRSLLELVLTELFTSSPMQLMSLLSLAEVIRNLIC